ncbi:MAG TPA: D-glycero-beta-D-manno-heptose 1-phosphate adenylyltransferase [Candidatus Moranbacteria bacterium]|nr:D-glycero-beta-D-manno-heptose 1-phosphate adenylyltransferase [Candidatus Moranbacteria bacterium]HBI50331.1 D-glycero-beta-D-manno-heptose 1-phosphate adenylyltransferase [Candidatus Moranbacteria bacterium]HBU11034.1 D-glycero-beta-D-manno-heptose 1-phosphate adenylyltransferase [Candidatus Moranbacteria bacterium]HCO99029.1 D-glycero-beta-D-manno-heptose 1-phosphate adenylyltransferase [Candidatus Moranbacteria bacterium]
MRDLLFNCQAIKTNGCEKMVLTTGAFDVLHDGHFRYLNHAKSLGDVLVVGINDDDFVKKIKGPDRPYYNQQARALSLSEFDCVDMVYIFSFEEQVELIEIVEPKFFVMSESSHRKPTERKHQIDTVIKLGGKIVMLPPFSDIHSTDIIKELRAKG